MGEISIGILGKILEEISGGDLAEITGRMN